MAFLLRVSHLCMFNVLLSSVAVYDTESTPLCGRMNGSTSLNDNDHIYFPDQSNGIRRMEINGTIITCNPDGTIISAIPANESLNAGITEDRLKERIEHKGNLWREFTFFVISMQCVLRDNAKWNKFA